MRASMFKEHYPNVHFVFSKRTIVTNKYNANTDRIKSIYSLATADGLGCLFQLLSLHIGYLVSIRTSILREHTKRKNKRNKPILYTHICNFILTVQKNFEPLRKMWYFFLVKFSVAGSGSSLGSFTQWWIGESNVTYEYWMWSHTWKWEFIETTSCVRSFILQWLRLAHHYIVVSRLFFVLSFVHSDRRILLLNRVCDHWWSF